MTAADSESAVKVLEVEDLKIMPAGGPQDRYMRFNNSILHYRDEYWIMAYRLYTARKPNTDDLTLSEHMRYHPWFTRWNGIEDLTIIAVLRYSPDTEQFETVNEIVLEFSETLFIFNARNNQLQDARLCWIGDNLCIYGQVYTRKGEGVAIELSRRNPKPSAAECLRIQNCSFVSVLFMRMEVVEHDGIPTTFRVIEVLSPCISSNAPVYQMHENKIIEKNWCFFQSADRRLMFEYKLHPHTVYSMDCKEEYTTPNDLMAIKARLNCGIYFSPGSPLIEWDDQHMIGVGHVKYKYTCVTLLPLSPDIIAHPEMWGSFVYAMFFYLVEKRPPYRLTKITRAFIPRHRQQKYAIVFPMAMCPLPPIAVSAKDQKEFIISYGEGDDFPMLLIASRESIQMMLDRNINADADGPRAFGISWWDLRLQSEEQPQRPYFHAERQKALASGNVSQAASHPIFQTNRPEDQMQY